MSRIDDLIRKLCPNGVDFKSLTELFNLRNGYTPSKSNPAYWNDNGTIPWFRMDDIRTNGGILNHALQKIPDTAVKGGNLFPANSLLVATSATIGEHALITVPHLSNQRFTSLALKPQYQHSIDMKYMYYYGFILDDWCRSNTTTSSFASVDMTRFKLFRVPVPPLAVQEEIVRVLDSFTALETELEAELEARKKQYEYYRNELLTFKPSAERERERELSWLTLADMENAQMIKLGRGKVISKQDIEENPGDYPVYSSSAAGLGEFGRYGNYLFDDERITWSIDGGGRFFYRPAERYSVTNVSGWLKVLNPAISTKFLFYQLETLWTKKSFDYTKKAHPSVIRREYTVAIPSLEVQHRIASILDKFDSLVNDISSGLPAEIAARRQQYEYYRDRLLTFKELSA